MKNTGILIINESYENSPDRLYYTEQISQYIMEKNIAKDALDRK